MRNQINIQHIKNYFSNKSVLALGIMMTVSLVLSGVVSFYLLSQADVIMESLFELVNDLEEQTSDLYEIEQSYQFFKIYYVFIYIVELIVAMLPVAAWLYIYFTSKSNNINKTPNAGFMYFFIVGIIEIVYLAFAFILSAIYGFLGVIFISSDSVHGEINGEKFYGKGEESLLVGSIFLIIALVFFVVFAISIGYAISKVKFFNATRKSMTSPDMKVSGKGYGVFSVINAILVILSGISTVISGIFFMFFADAKDFSLETEAETYLVAFVFKKLALPIILAGVVILISSIVSFLEAKVAFGYCKMAKTIPPTPMEQIYNNPYHQNIPPYGQRYYNTNQQYNGGVQNSSPIPPYGQPVQQSQPIPPYGQPVPQQNQQTQPEPIQQNDNTNPYEGNPYENN